jgi:hypothetical protein
MDGTPYYRREAVEAELQELSAISASELERRSALWPSTSPGFISPEALAYFVRNVPAGAHRDKLTEQLLHRVVRRVRRATDASGLTVSLTRMNILEDVSDHFVDLLLADRKEYDHRLDYYEVNFNSAIAKDRSDASARHWKHENRSDEMGSEEEEVSARVEAVIGGYNPFDADDLDKKDYRLLLDDAIDSLPEFQRRIVEMWRQEIPIESKDPSVASISKVLGKTEKTRLRDGFRTRGQCPGAVSSRLSAVLYRPY